MGNEIMSSHIIIGNICYICCLFSKYTQFPGDKCQITIFFAKFVDIILPTDLFIMESLKGKT